jgi:hypothetical protein
VPAIAFEHCGRGVPAAQRAREVGIEQYKNRLLAYLETRIQSGTTRATISAQLTDLAARLDTLYEHACKAVHDNVDDGEARLVVIQTYMFVRTP